MKISRSLLLVCALSLLVSLLCATAAAQMQIPQAQVTGSFSYLNSARDSINQRGFELSSGYNWLKWLTLGGDFCHYSGNGHEVKPILLPPPLPSFGNTDVGFNVNTYTVAVGTKFLYRKNKYVVRSSPCNPQQMSPEYRFLVLFQSGGSRKPNTGCSMVLAADSRFSTWCRMLPSSCSLITFIRAFLRKPSTATASRLV